MLLWFFRLRTNNESDMSLAGGHKTQGETDMGVSIFSSPNEASINTPDGRASVGSP